MLETVGAELVVLLMRMLGWTRGKRQRRQLKASARR